MIIGMNKELFRMLCANYDKEPNADLHKLWSEELKDIDSYYVETAIKTIMKTDKYFPTLNRIIEVLNNQPPMEIPVEEKIKRMKEMGVVPSWLKDYENNELA